MTNLTYGVEYTSPATGLRVTEWYETPAEQATCIYFKALQGQLPEKAWALTDLGAWEWPLKWGPQPYDQHIRHSLHVAEPRSREWEAEQDAAFVEAMEAEQARDRANQRAMWELA